MMDKRWRDGEEGGRIFYSTNQTTDINKQRYKELTQCSLQRHRVFSGNNQTAPNPDRGSGEAAEGDKLPSINSCGLCSISGVSGPSSVSGISGASSVSDATSTSGATVSHTAAGRPATVMSGRTLPAGAPPGRQIKIDKSVDEQINK